MSESTPSPGTERIAKVMAHAGLMSRREAEKAVEAGRVQVNGEVIYHPGHPVNPETDHIRLDGKTIPKAPRLVYFLLYKPRGYITGRDDPDGRKSVLDLVAELNVKVEPVGRLDMDTEGALLLTNDGDLAHRLTHPSNEVPRRYLAKVWKRPDERDIERLERGIPLEDGNSGPARVRIVEATDTDNCWIEITVTEGRNRLIRRLFAAIGHPVSKLRRLSFATISIRGLERGQFRALSGEELARLREISEGRKPTQAGHGTRYKKGFARPKPENNRPLSQKKKQRRSLSPAKPNRG